jgi:ribonuclease HII
MVQVGIADPWHYESIARSRGFVSIAGVDEVGRGPLAGPVVAAAVILPEDFDPEGIRDSKRLSPQTRETLSERIRAEATAVGLGIVSPGEIDEINILRATCKAMQAALQDLGAAFDFVLLDGLSVSGLGAESIAIVKGDDKSVSIASASIIAKVARDRIMCELDEQYPDYGFAAHKGYGCRTHLEALARHGPCPCHRRSFAPVGERLSQCRLDV